MPLDKQNCSGSSEQRCSSPGHFYGAVNLVAYSPEQDYSSREQAFSRCLSEVIDLSNGDNVGFELNYKLEKAS